MNDIFLWEIEDARALITDLQGDPHAFDFQMQMQPAAHEDNTSICYTVTVLFGSQRALYYGGYGLDWVGHFEFDLRQGVFGKQFTSKG